MDSRRDCYRMSFKIVRKITLFTYFIFIILVNLIANSDIDSLENQVKTQKGKKKIEILNKISYKLRRSEPQKSKEYAELALSLAKEYKDIDNECIAQKNIGNYYLIKKQYVKAKEFYQKGLSLSQSMKSNLLTADFFYNLAFVENYLHEFDSSINYFQQALTIYQKINETEKIANTLFSLGNVYWYKDQYEIALTFQEESLTYYMEMDNQNKIAKTCNNIGNLYFRMGNYNQAIHFYLQSLEIREKSGDQKRIAYCLSNIGNIYNKVGNHQKALETHLDVLQIYKNLNDTLHVVNTLNNIGVDYSELEKIKESINFYNRVFEYKNFFPAAKAIGIAFNNIGKIQMDQKDYINAIENFEQSINLKEKINDQAGLATTYKNMGYAYFHQNKIESAEDWFHKSMKLAKKIDDLEIIKECHGALSDIFFLKKNYKNAYNNLLQYSVLQDSLVSVNTNERINELMLEYETEKRKKEIELLKKEGMIKEYELKQERIIRNIFIFGLLIFFIVSFVIFKIKQTEIQNQKRIEAKIVKMNEELEQRVQIELSKQKKQQQLLIQKSKLESLGKLSAGIAHEINQPLGGISMGLENLYFSFEDNMMNKEYFAKKLKIIKGYIERINQIINHIRIFSRDQKSVIIEKINVNDVINDALGMFRVQFKKNNIQLTTDYQKQLGFTTGNKFKLEQVIVNLLSNAKDAVDEKTDDSQKKIRIRTFSDGNNIFIEVEDNGKGIPEPELDNIFDPFFTTKTPEKGTGLGLSIIYGIINEMQGEITVESKSGIFTKMLIKLPKVL